MVQRGVHVHKLRHVPYKPNQPIFRDKGRKAKKNRFKEIYFSLLIYEFHEKGAMFCCFCLVFFPFEGVRFYRELQELVHRCHVTKIQQSAKQDAWTDFAYHI